MDRSVQTDGIVADAASAEYLGRWNRLISTTNWEKGAIICQWRQALMDGEAPSREYSDEAWSRHVGSVSSQHVGRLRRVYERFGESYTTYEGLFWSHFHASLDWDDAEMWLEGAVQNDWSVSVMRRQRWETLGAVAETEPRDEDVATSEYDEDSPGALDEALAPRDNGEAHNEREAASPKLGTPDYEPDMASTLDSDGEEGASAESAEMAGQMTADNIASVRPFERVSDLPEDLADAFDSFKLAILRHKLAEWEEVSRDDVLAAVDGLRQLVLAPS